jgi:hypothetical protein
VTDSITTQAGAALAEALLQKIERDRAGLQRLVAEYFTAAGGDTFPAANDVALSLQDTLASLTDLRNEIESCIREFDESPSRKEHA